MNDTKKMLRAIINGQSAIKDELLGEIKKLREEFLNEIKKVRLDLNNHREETKAGFKKVNKRLDVIGASVAFLEDDAPTAKKHDNLEKRVKKLETSVFKN